MHLLDAGIVNEPGIGTGASDDELGPEQLGRYLHLVVVYKSCCSLQKGRWKKKGECQRMKKWRKKERILEGM